MNAAWANRWTLLLVFIGLLLFALASAGVGVHG